MMAHGLLIKIDSLSSETHSVHSRDAEAVGNIHLTLPRCRSACAAVEVMVGQEVLDRTAQLVGILCTCD